MYVVDGSECIELEKAWLVRPVLDVVEPAARNNEIWIFLLLGKTPAVRFYLTQSQTEPLPHPLQSGACPLGLPVFFHGPGP